LNQQKDFILEKIVNSGGLFWHEPSSQSGAFTEGFIYAKIFED
jgi:hypothetical protein